MDYVAGTQNELGHAMVTMIEPTHDPAELAEYNRWYEFDHAYSGVMIGPGAFAFRRWVATRALKDLRYPNPSTVAEPVDMGSFIAAYWFLDGSVEEHFQWSFAAMPGLVAAGRMNPNRTHVSTSLYDLCHVVNRAGWPVAGQIALDHPYQGMVAMWTDRADDASLDALAEWIGGTLAPKVLAGPVAQAITFAPRDMPGVPNSGVGVGTRLLTMFFVQADPREAWAAHFTGLDDAVKGSGLGTVGLVAPFIPVIPGTNTYLDELW